MGAGKKLWGWYKDGDPPIWVPLQVDINGRVVVDLSNISINELHDVLLTATGNWFVYFNAATTRWESRLLVDGDIPAAIARDAEVADAIADEATARDLAIAAIILNDLADVSVPAPDAGDMIHWDAVASEWVRISFAFLTAAIQASTNLADLADITIAALADGHFLSYSEGLGIWQNRLLAEGDIPADIARDTEVATAVSDHADKTTGTHGVGADYIAKAVGEQYVAVRRKSDTMLGQSFYRAIDNGVLVISGGQIKGATIELYGRDELWMPGWISLVVPNAALTGFKYPFNIEGGTNNPVIFPDVDNETDLGYNALKWRHIYTHGLTHDQLCVTDRKCGKCGKAFKVGDTWAYSVIKIEGDLVVKRPNTVSKLHYPDLPATRKVHKLNEWTGKYEDIDKAVMVKVKRKHYYEDKGKVVEHEIEEEVENEYQTVEGEVEMPADGFMTCAPVCRKCFLKV